MSTHLLAKPATQTAWPAPQFVDLLAGQRLLYTFCHERSTGVLVQLMAATSGEGTSSVVRDLALIAARMPAMRVLLMDLDAPGDGQLSALREDLDVTSVGSEILPSAADSVAIHQTSLAGLHVSESRIAPGAPRPAWGKILAGLRGRYDLILLDSPSMDRSFDGIMLAPEVDTTLLVVEAERTRSAVAQNLRDRILDAGGAIGGVVLNQQRYYIPKLIYRRL